MNKRERPSGSSNSSRKRKIATGTENRLRRSLRLALAGHCADGEGCPAIDHKSLFPGGAEGPRAYKAGAGSRLDGRLARCLKAWCFQGQFAKLGRIQIGQSLPL